MRSARRTLLPPQSTPPSPTSPRGPFPFLTFAGIALGALCLLNPSALSAGQSAKSGNTASISDPFIDHGILVPVSETRVLLATQDGGGNSLLVNLIQESRAEGVSSGSSRCSLLVHDLTSGKTAQYYHDRNSDKPEDIFAALVSSRGKLYFGRCNAFTEFDLSSRTFSFNEEESGGYPMSIAEGADGSIYFAVFPTSELFVFNPGERSITKLARLDDREKYPTKMGIDRTGWLYVGIGTAESNLVAYHPETGKLKSLIADTDRMPNDSGEVIVDENGVVYGRGNKQMEWMILEGGKGTPSPGFNKENVRIPKSSVYYNNTITDYKDGGRIENYSMVERRFDYIPANGERTSHRFDYETEGASIASMALAKNGKIYGSTHHPMRLWEFDPKENRARVLGHLPRVGNGCLTKFTEWNGKLYSNSYARGDFYVFDPALPFSEKENASQNPRFLMRTEPVIARPHTMLTYPGTPYLLSAGWPSYGLVGGGLLIYNAETEQQEALLTPEALLPGQTITTMVAMEDGTLAFGTAAYLPGGGHTDEQRALIGIFDWKTRKVAWSVPVPGGSNYVNSIVAASPTLLYGITHDNLFFVADVETQSVIAERPLPKELQFPSGGRGDNAFTRLPDGRILLVMTRGIFAINRDTHEPELLAEPPAALFESGAVVGNRLYLGSAGRLWSYEIPPASH